MYPLRTSKHSNKSYKIKLLLIEKEGVMHYCLINNISRLVSSQVSKHDGECFISDNCLNPFHKEESLDKHREYCNTNECIKMNMPKKGSVLKFNNYRNSEMVPYVIYADMESLLEPIQSCGPNPGGSYTEKFQKHKPISFSYYIKCFDDNVFSRDPRTYTGLDAPQKFLESLEKDVKEIANIPEVGRIYKEGDRERYKAVIFHNLSGYDSHLFIENLGFTESNIDCIPNNDEKYISFSKEITVGTYPKKAIDEEGCTYFKQEPIKYKIRFIYSFNFMSTSLNSLVNNLPEDGFDNLEKYYTGEKLALLKRKGVYPYEYMDSLERLMENKLPPKKSFYSRLTGEGISVEDYQHGLKVWKEFEIKTMKDYLELYNETDVLLLADVFENFRTICLENYKLDPAHYFTTPGLSWDAALKVTGINLELLSDIDMLLMVEKGIRGGVSMISNRYSKANNKYMDDKFNPSEPSKYIQYLDANNLYGAAMSMKLPTHGFKWMNDKELLVWRKIPCILEVDLEYPDKLHDLHNHYPLAPEKIKCKNEVEKLLPNLKNKEKYVIHYDNLKQYLSLGLRLTRIRRGIKFEESDWLKPYIDMNTKLRTKAKNNFEKDFFKLMNNSVFGKTIKNIRKRVDVKLVNDRVKAEKLVAKPNFNHLNIFCEELVAIHMKKTNLTMNKPVYLGMSILDLSKTIMYEFHYNYIKPKYGDKAILLFTDTDSLMYEIQTEDFYKDISGDVKDRFDTSYYPPNHPSGIPSGCNKKVLGMFKDEAAGGCIEEFLGLRSKLYSFKMCEGEETKKCKGLKKSVVKKSIAHEDYKTCLFNGKEQICKMNVIRSYNHELYTEEVNKVALCSDDDKRYILENRVNTLAWGHHTIPETFI